MEYNSGLPLGFKFLPTDSELLLSYLAKRVKGLALPCDSVILECDLYDGQDRWMEFFQANPKSTSMYVFTKLKKKTDGGKRIKRSSDGGVGTWKETQKEKNIFDLKNRLIGTKRCFKFQPLDQNAILDRRWLMDEFRLRDSFLSHSEKQDEVVVCRIKWENQLKSKLQHQQADLPLQENIHPNSLDHTMKYGAVNIEVAQHPLMGNENYQTQCDQMLPGFTYSNTDEGNIGTCFDGSDPNLLLSIEELLGILEEPTTQHDQAQPQDETTFHTTHSNISSVHIHPHCPQAD